ncbi:glycosyltransferase family 2 protein [bacterium]|nr:glycosyltransferase family 2 protein [candidate division CSSED10-310 bacterium]
MNSIIIVNYKVPDLLKQCIRSIYEAQSSESFEIFVIDNASGDNSKEIIMSHFPEVIWIQNRRNIGFSRAVNAGINASNGKFIILLNPDTRIYPGAFEAVSEFFMQNPQTGIIGGKIINPDGSVQPQCRRNIPKPRAAFMRLFGISRLFPSLPSSRQYELPSEALDSPQKVEAISGAFMCIKREVIDTIGLFDGNFFLYGEDLDYCYRATQKGFDIFYLPTASVVHVRGASRKKYPVRILFYTHHAMARFYHKHLASDHFFLFNSMIYLTIWMRWIAMIVITSFTESIRRK